MPRTRTNERPKSRGNTREWAREDKGQPTARPDGPVFNGSIDQFITLFLCGLVLKGKTAIWIRTSPVVEERRRMYALNTYLNEVCEKSRDGERNYLYFLVRLRNELSPGNIGGFDGFYHQIAGKLSTIVSMTAPFYETYDLEVSITTATSIIERAEPRMRELAANSVSAYMADLPK